MTEMLTPWQTTGSRGSKSGPSTTTRQPKAMSQTSKQVLQNVHQKQGARPLNSWNNNKNGIHSLAFFRSLNLGGCCCFAANFFYCLRLPFKLILGEVTKKCRGLDLGPLKISRIGKTPTPHHRKNAALPSDYVDSIQTMARRWNSRLVQSHDVILLGCYYPNRC